MRYRQISATDRRYLLVTHPELPWVQSGSGLVTNQSSIAVTRSNFARRCSGVMKPRDRSQFVASRLSRRSNRWTLESVKVEQAVPSDGHKPSNSVPNADPTAPAHAH